MTPEFILTDMDEAIPQAKKALSEEHRRKISEALRNNPKVRAAQLGKTLSEEHRRKISEANRGRVHSAETRAKISQAHQGKIVSDETRAKIGDRKRGTVLSTEHRQKISTALLNPLGKYQSTERSQKVSTALLNKPRPHTRKLTMAQVEEIRSRMGEPKKQLAREFGVGEGLINSIWIRKSSYDGYTRRPYLGVKTPEQRSKSWKMTFEQYEELKRRKNERPAKLAAEFGVSKQMIQFIRRADSSYDHLRAYFSQDARNRTEIVPEPFKP